METMIKDVPVEEMEQTIVDKLKVALVVAEGVLTNITEMRARCEQALRDPTLDYDDVLHKAFNSRLADYGMEGLKESDECAYNEEFNNWYDAVLKDGDLATFVPQFEHEMELVQNFEDFVVDVEEALETLEDALSTLSLMCS